MTMGRVSFLDEQSLQDSGSTQHDQTLDVIRSVLVNPDPPLQPIHSLDVNSSVSAKSDKPIMRPKNKLQVIPFLA